MSTSIILARIDTMKINFVYSLVANVYSALCKFLILLTIIRLGTPIEVGRYNYALVLSAPVFLLASLKIRSIIVTNDEYKVNHFFNAIILINTFFFTVFICIVSLLSNANETIIILVVSLIKFLDNIKEVSYGVYQKDEQLKIQSVSMIMYFTLSLVSFYLSFYITSDLLISLTLSLLSGLLTFFIFDIPVMKKKFKVFLKLTLSMSVSKKIMFLALPLSISSAIGSLNTGLPRVFLKEFFNEYALGIFSAIAYLLVVGTLLANSLSQVFLPRLRKLFKNNKITDFVNLTKKMVLIGTAVGIFSVIASTFLGRFVLKIFFGAEYANQNEVLIILSFGLLFILSGVFLGTSIVATGNYKVNYKISVITLLSIIIFSVSFIPVWGLIGTAYTITCSQLVAFLSYLYFYNKEMKKWNHNTKM